jgi:hypothetical protein
MSKHMPMVYMRYTHDAQTSRVHYILKHTPQVFCLKYHSCSSKNAHACLLTSGCLARRRLRPAATPVCCREGQGPCGEEGGKQSAYTLSPSQRLCVYVSACACGSSGVQVRADLKKQHVARQSSTRVNGHRDVKHKEYAFTVLLERDLDRHDSSYQSGPHYFF